MYWAAAICLQNDSSGGLPGARGSRIGSVSPALFRSHLQARCWRLRPAHGRHFTGPDTGLRRPQLGVTGVARMPAPSRCVREDTKSCARHRLSGSPAISKSLEKAHPVRLWPGARRPHARALGFRIEDAGKSVERGKHAEHVEGGWYVNHDGRTNCGVGYSSTSAGPTLSQVRTTAP